MASPVTRDSMHPLPCGRGSEVLVGTTGPFRAARASKRLFEFSPSPSRLRIRRSTCRWGLRSPIERGQTAHRPVAEYFIGQGVHKWLRRAKESSLIVEHEIGWQKRWPRKIQPEERP